MEPNKEDDANLSRAAIEKELADRKDDELLEMAKRLSRGTEGLKQVMADLEEEKSQLREEHEHLNKTIDLMMQELRKLNIGGDNTVDPQLEEGPLDFVGRFWEKMKPRDNTYLVSDNVGELRKISDPSEDQAEIRRHVEKKAKEVGQQLQGALGPLWSRAEGLLSAAQEELAGQVSAQRERRDGGSTPNGHGREKDSPGSGGYAGFAGFGSLLAKGQELLEARRGGQQSTGGSSSSSAASRPAPSQAAPAAPAAPAASAPAAQPASKKEEPKEVPKEKPKEEPKEAQKKAEETAAAEEQISSTVLIEASIKLEDGSVETLQVRAADRCKEVSHRFIQEHSLKAWFEQPLTAWLKKVEADAVKFPVKVEGDLVEIRKTHGKK